MLKKLGVETLRVRSAEELSSVDRLILPGGESTTMLRFIRSLNLAPAIASFAHTHPVWGICAGAILIAKEVHNPQQESLQLLNIAAHRNYYGSQLDSFSAPLQVRNLKKSLEVQFIRAPLLSPLPSVGNLPTPETWATLDKQPVFLAHGKIWATSFHVELGDDTTLHELFLSL
jgi:5'-phosphate synthase pdxT subunit